jgi:deoxyribose-phosphate aldolase
LTATPSRIDAGHTFIKKTLGITKTGIDVVNTVSPAVGAGKKVAGGVSTGIQVAKIINKTRQGQNHMS